MLQLLKELLVTRIGLCLVGNALGMKSEIVMPETQSEEKKKMLKICGAKLHLVEAVMLKTKKLRSIF